LHSVIFTRMQPWRWLWLMQAVSVLLLPVIGRDCWRSGHTGRTAVVLLISAWVLRGYTAAPAVSILSILSVLVGKNLSEPRSARLLFQGSVALLAVAIVINLTSTLASPIETWAQDGVICAALLISAWWWMQTRDSPGHAAALLAVASLLCVALAPAAWRSWTDYRYTPALRAAFAGWRDKIPPQAQVIWPGTPVGAWYLLERPSYYSIHQVAGDIFSRPKAFEVHRRAVLLQWALGAQEHESPSQASVRASGRQIPANADMLTAHGLAIACSDPELAYVVSWKPLAPLQLPPVTPDSSKARNKLNLNSCAELRDRAPAAPAPP
jgi:hypothetical protein